MPIKGVTENPRMPRVGKIHLGYMVQPKDEVKKPYPKATDYFVYPKEGSPGFDLVPQLIKQFGEKPKSFSPVFFALDDEESVASQYYRCYTRSRGLVCRGNGETCTRLIDKNTGDLPSADQTNVEMKDMNCAGRECPDYQAGKCREVMNLQFMFKNTSGIGIWQIDTSSINSMRNVNSCLFAIRSLYHRIDMVPLVLSIKEIEVTPPGGKKKRVHVLDIRSEDSLEEALLNSRKPAWELITGSVDLEQSEKDIEELWESGTKSLPAGKTTWPESEQERMLSPEESSSRMEPGEIEEARIQSEGDELKEKLFGKNDKPPPQVDPEPTQPPSTQQGDPSAADMYVEQNIKTLTDLYKALNRCWGLQPSGIWPEINFDSVKAYTDAPNREKPSLWDIFLQFKSTRQTE